MISITARPADSRRLVSLGSLTLYFEDLGRAREAPPREEGKTLPLVDFASAMLWRANATALIRTADPAASRSSAPRTVCSCRADAPLELRLKSRQYHGALRLALQSARLRP